MFSVKTDRLHIRPLVEDDASFINRLYNTDGFLRYIGDRNIRSVADARKFLLHGPLNMYREAGVGLCMVELLHDNTPVGTCGLIKRETLEDIDIGYAFLPEYGGQGYAYEAARAVFAFARDSLQLSRLVAITQADNTGSVRLLEKLGLGFEQTLNEADDPVALYAIDFAG